LFSQRIPSNNLGFVNSRVDVLELEIAGRDYTIKQSPGLLNSRREEGTTGAVLWKITPLLATWLASRPPVLADVLHQDAVVVELGCGVAGLIGLVLARFVQCYILTDLDYVLKHVKENVAANEVALEKGRNAAKKKSDRKGTAADHVLRILALDWESDSARNLEAVMPQGSSIDLILLCDCVYNEYLVSALVQTCADACRLGSSRTRATVVLIAQQLRTDTVFELFLDSLMREFDIWRVPDGQLSAELRPGSGYAVHLAMLKSVDTN
jgi:predicted nicotinamide N-methyase